MRTRAISSGARAALLLGALLTTAGCGAISHMGSAADPSGSPSVSAAAGVSGTPDVSASGAPSDAPSDAPTGSPSGSPSASATPTPAAPTEAGNDFRSATAIQQGEQATANAAIGDYLYWMFPADTGQRVTVDATVSFPSTAARHGTSVWQVDVYDGLRRRQPCVSGPQDVSAAPSVTSIRIACTLRTIRAWAQPWSNDPLRGGYYIRLTAVDVPETDLGLPVRTAVDVTSKGTGGADAVDGSVTPLVSAYGANVAPTGGWSSTWWSDRWLWTAGGGALGALAAVGGYCLTRGSGIGRPRRVPPDAIEI